MKKGKLLLAGTALLTSILFAGNVKADGPSTQWQTYQNGNTIYYNATSARQCHYSMGGNCKEYIISNDDGVEDEYVTLTNSDGSIEVHKHSLSGGYILVSGSEQEENYLHGETDIGDGDPASGVKDFMYIEFYDSYADAEVLLNKANASTLYVAPTSEGAHKYVTLYSFNGLYFDGNIKVENGVSIYAPAFGNRESNIINNGKLKVGALYANRITGNGYINIVYSADAEMGDPYFVFDRFSVKEISGVIFDITGATIKEGLQVGTPGEFGEISKENAQKMINMLNASKGDTLKGYKIILKEYNDNFLTNGGAYYGELEKETASSSSDTAANKITTTQKAATKLKAVVKNPKTADTLFTILGTIVLAGGAFVVTLKKAKQK